MNPHTLVQDLTETLGADHRHVVHQIALVPDSPLRHVVSGEQMTISCYHHQGIGTLGVGLRASAYAEDGTVEAVALGGHDGWYLGVQWHPEELMATRFSERQGRVIDRDGGDGSMEKKKQEGYF